MSQASKTTAPSRRPPRKPWQVACRVAGAIVLTVVAGYATLPAWLPPGAVKNLLEQRLTNQLGVPVHIESVAVTWGKGLSLFGLTIDSPEGFGPEPILRVDSVTTEFSPIRALLLKKIDWMDIFAPVLSVRVDSQGNCNLAPLGRLSGDIETQRIKVRQARAEIVLPRCEQALRVEVSDLEYLVGRAGRFGQVTLSAFLRQERTSAPIALHAGAGGGEVAAAANLSFHNIDLAQIPLPLLLNMPLSKLTGRCGGSLEIQVNPGGRVDRFNCNLVIRHLDVQPKQGPRLPIVEEAGFRMAAAITPGLDNLGLDIQSLHMRLPGIELAGRGSATDAILTGNLQAVRMLEFEAVADPMKLAALLGVSEPQMRQALAIEGPVGIRLRAENDETRTRLRLSADATPCNLTWQNTAIKPPGRTLVVDLDAAIDQRDWSFQSDNLTVRIGQNTFRGNGNLRNFRTLAGLWSREQPPAPAETLREISSLDWNGTWEIRELDSLQSLPGLSLLEPMTLEGVLTGQGTIHQEKGGGRLNLSLSLPAETRLAVGKDFVKPPGVPLKIDLSGVIDAGRPASAPAATAPAASDVALKNLSLELSVGAGRLRLADSLVRWRPNVEVEASGRLAMESIADLESLWHGEPNLKDRFGGDMDAGYRFHVNNTSWRGRMDADLTLATVAAAPWFLKPTGKPAAATIDLSADPALHLRAEFRGPQFAGALAADAPRPPKSLFDPLAVTTDVTAQEIASLLEFSPVMQKQLSPLKLGGAVAMRSDIQVREGTLHARLACDATPCRIEGAAPAPFCKPSGIPLKLALDATVRDWDDRLHATYPVEVAEAKLDLAHCQVSLKGRAIWPRRDETAAEPSVISMPETFSAVATASVAADDMAMGLCPELARLLQPFRLAGKTDLKVSVTGKPRQTTLLAEIVADDLAFILPSPHPIAKITMAQSNAGSLPVIEEYPRPLPQGLTKPAGLPMRAEAELNANADWSQLHLNNLHIRAAGADLLAGGNIAADKLLHNLPTNPGEANLHFAMSTTHAASLGKLFPDLAPYNLSGQLLVDVQTERIGTDITASVALAVDRLRGRYRGKELALTGDAALTGIQVGKAFESQAMGVSIRSLELACDKNHGLLEAQLAGVPRAVEGQFHLSADYLNDQELAGLGADAPASQPRRDKKLTPKELDDLARRSAKAIEQIQPYLLAARVEGRMDVGHFRVYDEPTDSRFDIHELVLAASVDRGKIDLSYLGGVNGGTVERRYVLERFAPDAPLDFQTDIRRLIARKNIQPQIAMFFPGNTVSGEFSRSERVRITLGNLVAGMIDSRYPVRPVGSGKTITTDGVVEGRAAPEFVTRIFPGLNLSKLHYDTMTGFAELKSDGTAVNDMIFRSSPVDVYMEGTTDAQNIGRYEIGLILLGTPQTAEFNHSIRQGRIPILKFKGLIENGKILDQEVSYLWPNETLFTIFLKNNIFYRLWLKSRGQT